MTDIQPFAFEGQAVRVVADSSGEPWFVAADVCSVLGIRNVSQAVGRLDDDERGVCQADTPGGPQRVLTISEPGLYTLVLRSDKPDARPFMRWISHDVVPSIRRTGSYSTPAVPDIATPAGVLAMAEQFAATARALVAAEEKVAELEPQAEAAQKLLSAEGDLSLREAAQVLSRDHGIDVGQNRLLVKLRDLGWVDMRGRPYQDQIKTGRVAVRTRSYEHPHTGEPTMSVQVRITPKGLLWLHRNWPNPPQLSLVPGDRS